MRSASSKCMNGSTRYKITIDSENAPGTLYHIAGTMLRKKINIETLHVQEVDPKKHLSRFKIEILLEPDLMEKVIRQIRRIIEVVRADYEVVQEIRSAKAKR